MTLNIYAANSIECDVCDSMIVEILDNKPKKVVDRPYKIHQNSYHRAHSSLHMESKTKKGRYKTYCVKCYSKVKGDRK